MEGEDQFWEWVYDKPPRERLDKVLAAFMDTLPEELGASRSWVKAGIGKGLVTLNGVVASKGGQKVKRGDVIRVQRAVGTNVGALSRRTENFVLEPNASLSLEVLYEDAWIAVVNKPKGMVMHGSKESGRNFNDSLVNALLARYGAEGLSKSEDGTRPGIVHRLDVETSGVVVVARTDAAYQHLHAQFRDRKRAMERTYVAIVTGGFGRGALLRGTVDEPIGRHPKHGTRRCVWARGAGGDRRHVKEAITHWEVRDQWRDGSVALIECNLETGRTHQIRVHMKHATHPLLCDPLYGPGNAPGSQWEPQLQAILDSHGVAGQFLHARSLAFEHPDGSRGRVRFDAPLPPYFQEAVDFLAGGNNDDKHDSFE